MAGSPTLRSAQVFRQHYGALLRFKTYSFRSPSLTRRCVRVPPRPHRLQTPPWLLLAGAPRGDRRCASAGGDPAAVPVHTVAYFSMPPRWAVAPALRYLARPHAPREQMGSVEEIEAQIGQELRYQSSLEPSERTYQAIRHIPKARQQPLMPTSTAPPPEARKP